MKSLVRLCAATLCVVPFTGCGGGNSVSQPPPSSVNVTLTPGSTSLLVKTSTTFAATVTGHSNTAVTYSVMEGTSGGNILSSGVYTAPAKPGSYTVRATSVADPSRHADATVSVHDYKHTIALSAKTIDGYDYHTASLLPDGSILIVGGRGYVDLIHQQALRYSPASGAFAPDASLATARAAHAAFTLPDGKVVVAGGYNPYSGGTAFDPVFTSSEIYDPATKKFSPGPEMNFPRRQHVATALKDSRVLITGGTTGIGRATAYLLAEHGAQVFVFGRNREPLEETLEVLDEQVRAGKIRHVGLSNETPWGTMRFLQLAEQRGWPRAVSIQNPYNLLNRSFEVGLAEVAIRERCGLLAYSPLAFGMLSGKYDNGARPANARITLFSRFTRYTNPQSERACARYVALAREHGLDPAQMALAFVTRQPFVTSNIIGATSLEQLESNLASFQLQLSEEVLAGIEAIHKDQPNPAP